MDKKPASAALSINPNAYPYDRPRIGTVVTRYGQYLTVYAGDSIGGSIVYDENEANSRFIQDKSYFPDAKTIYYKNIYLTRYEDKIQPCKKHIVTNMCEHCKFCIREKTQEMER